eukprot:COSAG02_NODE_67067_length_254_cov_0.496774_2_plen_30_part_01
MRGSFEGLPTRRASVREEVLEQVAESNFRV